MTPPLVLTGAAGTLGTKLRRHLAGRPLRLLDRDPRGDPAIHAADLNVWDPAWVDLFRGADTVVHLAADPEAHRAWPDLVGPNLDATMHAYEAAAQAGVRRFVFASSNHVLGGYHDSTERLTPETPPLPGLRYTAGGEERYSGPYASAKLCGERLGKAYAATRGLEVIAVRFGWVLRGKPNTRANVPADRGDWFRLMWLSDRDYLHLMDRCLAAELPSRFVIVHGMSDNAGMRWDLTSTREILGYDPQDDVTRSADE